MRNIRKLLEKFMGYVEDSSMETSELTPIEFNPSSHELNKLLKKYKALRVLADEETLSDIYVWDSNGAYHEEVLEEFSVGNDYFKGIIHRDSYSGKLVWELNVYEFNYGTEKDGKEFLDKYRDEILKSPIVTRYKIDTVAINPRVMLNVNEEYFKSFNHPHYEDLDVFKNPTRLELMKYLKQHEDNMARFFIEEGSGDLYYWDGNILHEEMEQITRIKYGKLKGAFHLTEGSLFASFEANTLYSFDNNFDLDDYYQNPNRYVNLINKVNKEFNNNPNIKRLGQLQIDWEK